MRTGRHEASTCMFVPPVRKVLFRFFDCISVMVFCLPGETCLLDLIW
jgi:hypothetical protein